MLQLKGRVNSSNVMKALWVLDEIGLDYEREDVGGAFGKNHEAPYLGNLARQRRCVHCSGSCDDALVRQRRCASKPRCDKAPLCDHAAMRQNRCATTPLCDNAAR